MIQHKFNRGKILKPGNVEGPDILVFLVFGNEKLNKCKRMEQK